MKLFFFLNEEYLLRQLIPFRYFISQNKYQLFFFLREMKKWKTLNDVTFLIKTMDWTSNMFQYVGVFEQL